MLNRTGERNQYSTALKEACLSHIRLSNDIRYPRSYDNIKSRDKRRLRSYRMQSSTVSVEQNVSFTDEAEVDTVPVPPSISSMLFDSSANVDLGNFLQRPVLIHTYTWAENTEFNQNFSPWKNYFNNSAVKKKLDNYHLLRCNLNLKFIINASPFYYSCIMVTYRPLSDKVAASSFEPCPVNGGVGLENQTLLGRSQRPRLMLYPQNSQGGSMVLPFFWHKNWLNANDVTDFEQMGVINMDSLFFVLSNANNVVGADCTIQVYAWASELQLAGPTVGFSMQSKDEYGKGIISQPASAIARMARSLSQAPTIGPLATATAIAAGATSEIASLFGFTNVPVISDVQPRINKPNPNFASTDIGIPVEKLTLDAKNELTIDNRSVGVDLGDELLISSLVVRETFLYTYPWLSTQAPDDLIFSARVTPEMVANTPLESKRYIQGTPMWMVTNFFKFWRGDIIFRFKFLCTKFHRGRVKISWDPFGDIGATSESTNLVYTKIVDISEDTDIEISIPYTQTTSYLNLLRDNQQHWSDSPLTNIAAATNGVLTMRVLTKQTAPSLSADIGVCVFVRGAPNLEFANPAQASPAHDELSLFAMQSKLISESNPLVDIGLKPSMAPDHINLVHMGEHITSLRTLLRRAFYHRTLRFLSTDLIANQINILNATFARMPLYYGFDPNGIDTAFPTVGAAIPFNYVHSTPLNIIGACFVALKGSVVWHLDVNIKSAATYSMTLDRRFTDLTVASYKSVLGVANGSNASEFIGRKRRGDGAGGLVLSDSNIQHGSHFHVPYYSKLKFASTNHTFRTLGSSVDDTTSDSVTLQNMQQLVTPGSNDSLSVDFYCSAGTDFNPIFFLNVPGYSVVPVPPPG